MSVYKHMADGPDAGSSEINVGGIKVDSKMFRPVGSAATPGFEKSGIQAGEQTVNINGTMQDGNTTAVASLGEETQKQAVNDAAQASLDLASLKGVGINVHPGLEKPIVKQDVAAGRAAAPEESKTTTGELNNILVTNATTDVGAMASPTVTPQGQFFNKTRETLAEEVKAAAAKKPVPPTQEELRAGISPQGLKDAKDWS
jgi:hypothetical protein